PSPRIRVSPRRRAVGSKNWSEKSVSSSWNWIFFARPCGESGVNGLGRAFLAEQHLRGDPGGDGAARRSYWDRTDVRAGRGRPCRILPALAGLEATRGGNRVAR